MKNIIFSADPALIQKAREQARKAGMTLNDAFHNSGCETLQARVPGKLIIETSWSGYSTLVPVGTFPARN